MAVIKDAYVKRKVVTDETTTEARAGRDFDETVRRDGPIPAYFCAMGKCDRLEVVEGMKPNGLLAMANKAMVPAFAAIVGMPHSGTTEQAQALAKEFGVP